MVIKKREKGKEKEKIGRENRMKAEQPPWGHQYLRSGQRWKS